MPTIVKPQVRKIRIRIDDLATLFLGGNLMFPVRNGDTDILLTFDDDLKRTPLNEKVEEIKQFAQMQGEDVDLL